MVPMLLLSGFLATELFGGGAATSVAEAAPTAAVYVRAGKLLDVRTGKMLSDQVILIRGEKIESVAPAAQVQIPAGAVVVDLTRATVLPGLIDAHDHLTSSAKLHGYRALTVSIPRETIYGVTNAQTTLAAGFTTARNVGASGFTDVALRDAINDGDVLGPRLLVSGPALGITGGHCDNNLLPPDYNRRSDGVADSPWAARIKVRENIKYGADLIKFCASGGVLSKGDQPGTQQYTLEEMKAIVDEAHRLGRKVAAHAHGTEAIKQAIEAGVDSIEHASLIDDEGIRLAKEHGTFLVMDIYNDDYILGQGAAAGMLPESLEKERKLGQIQRDNFARAHRAGARMAFGTDGGVYPHGENAKQFPYMVKYGMTSLEAIQAATINAAELLGWADRVGAIEPGKYGDLIAVEGSPLDDVTVLEKVKCVIKGGVVVRNDWGK
jgi:imidazolonepropionase-like amidohydrolase